MATNQIPLYLDPGVGVRRYTGTDTIYHNLTDSSGNVLDLHKNGSSVISVSNDGMLTVGTVASPTATTPSFDVWGRPNLDDPLLNQILRLYDADVGEEVLAITKTETNGLSGAWAVNFVLRNESTPQEDDEALRITHDVLETTPTYPLAKLLSIGRTNDSGLYVETFNFNQGGSLLWGTDGGGSIGASSDNRPATIYASNSVTAATSVNAAGSVLKVRGIDLGPAEASDKTITALQAATSPYIKYVNGSTKWQFSNDGVTPLDFGTSNVEDWDDLYAASQTMSIGTSSPLTWTQTSTAGYGFVVDKTVTGATTAIMKVAANTGGYSTSIPVLEVARADAGTALQLNGHVSFVDRAASITSAKALNIKTTSNYEYLTLETTGNPGKLYIKTSAYAGSELNITSGDTLVLNSANGAGASLTAGTNMYLTAGGGGGLGAMYVDATGGALSLKGDGDVTLWMASTSGGHNLLLKVEDYWAWTQDILFDAHGSGSIKFNSNTDKTLTTTKKDVIGAINEVNAAASAVPTWDQIYAGSQTLSISGSGVPLTFTQTGNVGSGFVVNRDKAAGFSTLPIMTVDNQNAGDDQSALAVSAAVSTSTALSALTSTLTASAAHTSGISIGVESIIVPHASDTAGGYYRAFLATGSAVGSGSKDGFYADANWGYGLYSNSPCYIEHNSSTTKPTLSIYRAEGAASTDSAVLQVLSAPGSVDDQPVIFANYLDNSSMSAGTVTVVRSEFEPYDGAMTGGTVNLYNATFTPHSGDSGGYLRGYYAQGPTQGTHDGTYGVYADANWDYGVYCDTKAFFRKQSIVDTNSWTVDTVMSSGGLASGEYAGAHFVNIAGHASDDANSKIYGIWAQVDTTGSAEKRAFYTNANWTYGLYTGAKVFVQQLGITTNTSVISANGYPAATGLVSGNSMVVVDASANGDSDDDSGAYIYGVRSQLTPNNTHATTYGFHADGDWVRGLYSASPIEVSMVVVDGDRENVASLYGLVSDMIGSDVCGIDLHLEMDGAEPGADAVYGINLRYTDNSVGQFPSGINIDANWNYGIYSKSPGYITATGTGADLSVLTVAGVGNDITGSTVKCLDISYTADGADTGLVYGAYLSYVAAGDANSKIGILIDPYWDYGLQAYARSIISDTFSAAGNALSVGAESEGGLTTGEMIGVLSVVGGETGDTSGASLIGFKTQVQASSGSAVTYGFYAYTGSTYGMYSLSPVRIDYGGAGAPTSDLIQCNSVFAAATALGANIDIYTYYSGITADASDNASATYTGYFAKGSGVGAATQYAFRCDDVWDYGLYSVSKCEISTYPAAGVGDYSYSLKVTDTSPAAGLNTGDIIHTIDIGMIGDSDDATASVRIGTQISATRNSTPSYMWGLYIENLGSGLSYSQLMKTVGVYSINNGSNIFSHSQTDGFGGNAFRTLYANADSASSGTVGLHQSDQFIACNAELQSDSHDASEARMYGFYATGQATRYCQLYGAYVDENHDYGIVSAAPQNLIQKQSGSTVGSSAPVLTVENASTSASYGVRSLKVINEYNSSTAGSAIEIDHANTSTTEGSTRALVFTSSKTNSRYVPLERGESTTSSYTNIGWRFHNGAGNCQWRIDSNQVEMSFPLDLPHKSTLTYISINFYANVTFSVAPWIRAYYHPNFSWTGNTIATTTGTTSAGTQVLIISGLSTVIDNKASSYYVRLNSGTENYAGYRTITGVYYVYTINDLSAAPGW